ncbi:MAG: acyl-CoA dehydrogenase, partial [Lysinibacillus sp.]
EINRMIVPGTFMKKALKGELPLLQVAQDLQNELLMLMPEEIGEAVLEQEKYLVKNAKKIAVLAAGAAAQRFGAKLDQEQEVLVNIANIANQLYAMESALIRTQKAIARDGEEKAAQKILYTQIFCQEAFAEIEKEAKETILATVEGDSGRMILSALRKLTRNNPYNIIMKKREASVKLIEAAKYVV